MSLPLAAVGAVVAALFETSLAPFLQFGGAQPDLLLVIAVIWTMIVGLEGGMAWAFVGGLTIDLLGTDPLGSTAFALLVSVGVAALAGRFMGPARLAGPVLLVFVLSIVESLVLYVLVEALQGPVPVPDLASLVVPRAIYNTVLALPLTAVAVLIRRRRETERVDW